MRGKLTTTGIWVSDAPVGQARLRPALFLDRDGVLVKEVEYLHRPEDVVLEDGAAELLTWARQAGLWLVVVTNQAGIARNYFDWAAFEAVQQKITAMLAGQGCIIDLVIACPFHPEHTAGYNSTHAHWRKPGAGMLRQAANILSIEMSGSWMIGDNDTDIGAAKAAGLAGALHVATGHGRRTRAAALTLAGPGFEVVPCEGLQQARTFLEWNLA